MKRFFTTVLALTLALSLTACGTKVTIGTPPASTDKTPAAPAAKTQLDEIKAAGKIVLGTSADYPPYEFHKVVDGKDTIVGWEMDMAQAVAQELGVKLEIKESAFDNLIADLMAKKVDIVISAMTINDDRKKSVDFSQPYWKAGQVVMTLKEKAATYKTDADFSGKTIAVQLGTTGEEEAKKIAGAKVKPMERFDAAVLDLLSGKADLVICDYTVGKNYEKNNAKLQVIKELNSEENGVVIRKGNKELVDAVNAALAKIKADGRLDQFVKKYEAEAGK